MSSKIYTIKNNETGNTFKVQLDHKPSDSEMMELYDKQMEDAYSKEAKSSGSVNKSAVGVRPPMPSIGQYGKTALGEIEAPLKMAEGLSKLTPPGIIYGLMKGKGYYPYEMAKEVVQHPSNNIPIYSNFKNAYQLAQAGKLKKAGEQAGEGAISTGLALSPFLKTPIKSPEVLKPEVIQGEGLGGALSKFRAVRRPINIEAQDIKTAGGMESPQSGLINQIRPTKQLTSSGQITKIIKSPGEIGTTRKFNLPSKLAFGSMPSSELDVQRLSLPSTPEQPKFQIKPPIKLLGSGSDTSYETSVDKTPIRINKELDQSLVKVSKNPEDRIHIEKSIGLMKNEGLSPEQIMNHPVIKSANPIIVSTAITKNFGSSINSPDQVVSKTETGYTSRKQKSLAKRLKQSLQSRGITFGDIENEPKGIILPSGLGGLQQVINPKSPTIQNAPGYLESYFANPQRTLARFPETKQISEYIGQTPIRLNHDIHKSDLEEADIFSKLNDKDTSKIINLLESYEDPLKSNDYTPQIRETAQRIRNLMRENRAIADRNFKGANIPIPIKQQKGIGYLSSYFPQVQAYEGNEFAGLLDRYLNSGTAIRKFIQESKNLFQHKSEGTEFFESRHPGSPYIMRRKGTLANTSNELQTIVHSYNHSILSVGHLRPLHIALDNRLRLGIDPPEIKSVIKSVMKQLKTPSLDDEMLSQALTKFSRLAQSALYTSKLSFVLPLQTLHAGNWLSFAIPKIGIKNTAYGLNYFLRDPVNAWRLVQNIKPYVSTTPWTLRSWPSRIRDLGMLYDFGRNLTMSMSIGGFIRQAIDEGYPSGDAYYHGAYKMLQSFGVTSLGSHPPILADATNNPLFSWLIMYKTTPYNLGEEWYRTTQNLIHDPNVKNSFTQFMTYLVGGLLGYEIYKHTGIALTHISTSILKLESVSDRMLPIFDELIKGNTDKAWDNFLKFIEPETIPNIEKHGLGGGIKEYPKDKGIPNSLRHQIGISNSVKVY